MMGSCSAENTLELCENLSIMSVALMLMGSEKHEIDTSGVSTVSKGGDSFTPIMRYTKVKFLNHILKFMLVCLGSLAKLDIT